MCTEEFSGETLLSGNENLILYFDDDGEELSPGDRVLVNYEVEATIGGIEGMRRLVGFPNDEIVHSLELIPD
ncbi:MAG: hypothetical protein HS105_05510 [Chloracidobacterium sp.]|nr:hypothetical protein [Chloracidobacterium sp.]